jgi:hypothetical protein
LLKPTSDPAWYVDAVSKIGVPLVVLLIILSQLSPKIDRQTEVAERTSAYLGALVARPPCGA